MSADDAEINEIGNEADFVDDAIDDDEVDPDEEALAYTATSKYVGADRIVWASDYPHPDAKIPGVVRELEEATETLSAEQRRLIFGENAARLYNI